MIFGSKVLRVLPVGYIKRTLGTSSVCLILVTGLAATTSFSVTDGHPLKRSGAYGVAGRIVH